MTKNVIENIYACAVRPYRLGLLHRALNCQEPVWYENLSGVVSCPENSNINTDGLDSVVIGSRDE